MNEYQPNVSVESYKQAHENFMKGLQGTTMFETTTLLMILPIGTLFHRILVTLIFGNMDEKSNLRHSSFLNVRFCVDFLVYVFPMFITFTKTEWTPWILSTMLVTSLTLSFLFRNRGLLFSNLNYKHLFGPKKPFITGCRSGMLIATFIAILAVDFPVFPRRFAKTETYGVSLMDVGVGSFLFANALTSKQALNVQKTSRFRLFLISLKSVTPLLIMGFLRILSVKATDYQEHVSEYGVHWNFFFTLAFVNILLALLNPSTKWNALTGAIIVIIYQILLSKFGISDYIQNHPRIDLISQNKEGIFSSIGYTALFLFGSQLGNEIANTRPDLTQWQALLAKFLTLDLAAWILYFLANNLIEPVSRRMANLSYVFSVVAVYLLILLLLLLIDLITPPQENVIISAVNSNALAMFLLANLCTGAVNLSMQTIYAADHIALTVLFLYLLLVTTVATLLWKVETTLLQFSKEKL